MSNPIITKLEMKNIDTYVRYSHDDEAVSILKAIFQDEAGKLSDNECTAEALAEIIQTMKTEMGGQRHIYREFVDGVDAHLQPLINEMKT